MRKPCCGNYLKTNTPLTLAAWPKKCQMGKYKPFFIGIYIFQIQFFISSRDNNGGSIYFQFISKGKNGKTTSVINFEKMLFTLVQWINQPNLFGFLCVHCHSMLCSLICSGPNQYSWFQYFTYADFSFQTNEGASFSIGLHKWITSFSKVDRHNISITKCCLVTKLSCTEQWLALLCNSFNRHVIAVVTQFDRVHSAQL